MRTAVAVAAWLTVGASLAAYDFIERPRAMLPGPPPAGGVELTSTGFWQSAYRSAAFADSDLDAFQIDAFGHHAIVDAGRWRTSIFYGTHLLAGPVVEGTTPGAEAAQWIMNAIQYEYGVVVARYADFGLGGARVALLAEYARRSYHPFLSELSEPAADLLRIGVGAVGMQPPALAQLEIDALLRLGWTELYEFWGADAIPAPRARYTLHSAVETSYVLQPAVALFAVTALDLIVLRSGGLSADLLLQTGARFSTGPAKMELFLDGYSSQNTEQLSPNQTTAATLWGWGLRFVLAF